MQIAMQNGMVLINNGFAGCCCSNACPDCSTCTHTIYDGTINSDQWPSGYDWIGTISTTYTATPYSGRSMQNYDGQCNWFGSFVSYTSGLYSCFITFGLGCYPTEPFIFRVSVDSWNTVTGLYQTSPLLCNIPIDGNNCPIPGTYNCTFDPTDLPMVPGQISSLDVQLSY